MHGFGIVLHGGAEGAWHALFSLALAFTLPWSQTTLQSRGKQDKLGGATTLVSDYFKTDAIAGFPQSSHDDVMKELNSQLGRR
eukprot:1946728-Pleurochrysis_carterae.AAC.1